MEITPVPIGFREEQRVAWLRANIFPDFVRMDCASHRVAELQFVVANGMAADDCAIRLGHFGEAAAENLFENFWRAGVGKGDDSERGDRATAHCVDVAERVGCCDLAKEFRVIYDRREKINGLHDSEVVGEAINGSVVAGFETDDHVRIGLMRKAFQHCVEHAGA